MWAFPSPYKSYQTADRGEETELKDLCEPHKLRSIPCEARSFPVRLPLPGRPGTDIRRVQEPPDVPHLVFSSLWPREEKRGPDMGRNLFPIPAENAASHFPGLQRGQPARAPTVVRAVLPVAQRRATGAHFAHARKSQRTCESLRPSRASGHAASSRPPRALTSGVSRRQPRRRAAPAREASCKGSPRHSPAGFADGLRRS